MDRLLTLSSCHTTLRHVGIRSLDAYRSAPPATLRGLHCYQATTAAWSSRVTLTSSVRSGRPILRSTGSWRW
jgi:hypothetical protein